MSLKGASEEADLDMDETPDSRSRSPEPVMLEFTGASEGRTDSEHLSDVGTPTQFQRDHADLILQGLRVGRRSIRRRL